MFPRDRLMRAFWATGMVAVFGLGWQIPAVAMNDDMIDPDNVDHYVDRNSLTTNGEGATARGIAQLNESKMNATVTGSGDVEVYDSGYGDEGNWNNVRGQATCVDKTFGGLECDVYEVRFNETNLDSYSEWLHVGCHEFGHTAGLWHRSSDNDTNNNSCMRSGGTNGLLDDHDIAVINDDV
jgi:hypothetical protein